MPMIDDESVSNVSGNEQFFAPQAARAGDRLEAQVEASDPDYDRVDLTYKWYRNDTVIKEGEDSFLDTAGLSTLDRIAVEVTASDPAGSASSLKSESLALGNTGPKIISTPPSSAVQERFDYSVKALDTDGDPLTYHLPCVGRSWSASYSSL